MQRRFMVSLILVAIGLPAVAFAQPAHPSHPHRATAAQPAQAEAPRRLPSHVKAEPLPLPARGVGSPSKALPPGQLKRLPPPEKKPGLKRLGQ